MFIGSILFRFTDGDLSGDKSIMRQYPYSYVHVGVLEWVLSITYSLLCESE